MRSKFCLCFLLLLACLVGIARADLSKAIDATCRVSATDGSVGTGCAIENAGGYVMVMTNAHVATTPTVTVEFWQRGHQSRKLNASVVLRSQDRDVAIVSVPTKDFGNFLPAIIPLAPPDYVLQPGQTILSVGCARGQWASAWRGNVIGYSNYGENDIEFMPSPENGRSGSAIFDERGEMIVALLHARTGPEVAGTVGLAINLQNVYAAIFGSKVRTQYVVSDREVFWPPQILAQCPVPGNGPAPYQPPRVLPYRERQDDINRDINKRIQDLYPTLPVAPPSPIVIPPAPAVPVPPVAPPVPEKVEPALSSVAVVSIVFLCVFVGAIVGLVVQWKATYRKM